MSEKYKKKFYDITNLIQQEFDRNVRKYGEKIQCRKGCSQCCHQIFNITLIDACIIAEHVKSLPPERQEVLKRKASGYLVMKAETPYKEDRAFSGSPDEFP